MAKLTMETKTTTFIQFLYPQTADLQLQKTINNQSRTNHFVTKKTKTEEAFAIKSKCNGEKTLISQRQKTKQ